MTRSGEPRDHAEEVETTDITSEFDRHYRILGETVMLRIERAIIGSDYGASSFTTLAQADRLSELLGLEPGKLFLDIGSGTGWPGIHMARRTGSQVLLTDVSVDGLVVAKRRLADDEVVGAAVAAPGDLLPFRDGSIDAVTSSDAHC